MAEEGDPWTCSYCGRRYVVASLARACEDRHTDPDPPSV